MRTQYRSGTTRVLMGAIALLLILPGCGKEAVSEKKGGGERPVPVTTAQVRLQPWNDTVQALGNVKARESVTITAKVSETVQSVHFDSGDVVAAGAPLVTLSGQSQQAALAEAQAAANEADSSTVARASSPRSN